MEERQIQNMLQLDEEQSKMEDRQMGGQIDVIRQIENRNIAKRQVQD